jgi:glutamate synthase (NADPH/NADH) small chain
MEKSHVDRRVLQMTAEAVIFRTGIEVGTTLPMTTLLAEFDSVVLAGGAEWPRNLEVPGRELDGIHYAMDFLTQQNKRGAGDDEKRAAPDGTITARGKHVVVIGGGDTGSDCIGTAIRRSSHAHEEGCDRDWAVTTKRAVGADGHVTALDCARVEWGKGADGRMTMREVPGSEFSLKADLVLLAMGFLGPRRPGLLEQAGVALDARGNVRADTNTYATSVPRVFAAGDMRRGQSLVVWAIREGRQCARAVDRALMGTTMLPA